MALRYTVGFAHRDPIGLVTVKSHLRARSLPAALPPEAGSVLRRHGFGADMPFRLGVEEELPLADRQSLALRAGHRARPHDRALQRGAAERRAATNKRLRFRFRRNAITLEAHT
jgi:hypothetical protein